MKKNLTESNKSIKTSASKDIIEETPMKDENDVIISEKMTRDIQRLAHRLRSTVPSKDCFN
jgi:hypothetical protein